MSRAGGAWRTRAELASVLLLLLVPAASFLAASPRFGGYDSYYFLLYADDLAKSASETSFARYSYFPGSYQFLRVVALAAGRDFASYQTVYAGVCLGNAALTGLIVRAAGGGALLAAGTFCGYLLFGQRLDVREMTTEPLATLVALAGILFWQILERRGRSRAGMTCLGAGYGLAVFMKQQGAFVAVGAIGLAPFLWGRSRSWRQGLGDAATMVGMAVAVFAVGMGLDGGGVAAVKRGVETVLQYEGRGQLFAHLVGLAGRSPALFAALAGSVCLWPVAFNVSHRRPADDRTALVQVWGLGATTAVLTLLQFAKRGYTHYALLTLPFALMAIAPAGLWSWERWRAYFGPVNGATASPRSAAAKGGAIVFVAAIVLGIDAWAWRRAPRPAGVLRHQVYASMCEGIQPGQRLLLLPSRENALHWACGTHARGTRWGYTFNYHEDPGDYIEELSKQELSQVFVFKADAAHAYEQEIFAKQDWSGFYSALARQGFRPVTENAAGTLYRRELHDHASTSPVDEGHNAHAAEETVDGRE